MRYTPDERLKLREDCELIVPGHTELGPAQEFRAIADWCEREGVRHDHYGEGKLIGDFERKIAALLGQPAAVFMPSGIMAQSAAVKIWTEAAHLPRFGMHPTSHLAAHEEQAWSALLHCHGVPIGDRLRPMLASDLDANAQPMACLLVELPIREAGGQLPSWDELEALKAAAQRRGIRLHMDGARLWESAAFYGKTHAEIATGFDSVYVSVYKGIGGLSGAVLAGPVDFIAQARLWRRRLGGTLFHLSPMVASAAMRFAVCAHDRVRRRLARRLPDAAREPGRAAGRHVPSVLPGAGRGRQQRARRHRRAGTLLAVRRRARGRGAGLERLRDHGG
jgi:threonine aldolase